PARSLSCKPHPKPGDQHCSLGPGGAACRPPSSHGRSEHMPGRTSRQEPTQNGSGTSSSRPGMHERHGTVLIPQISCLRSQWKCRALLQQGGFYGAARALPASSPTLCLRICSPLAGVWSLSQSPITVANSVNLCCGPTSGARASYKVQRDLVPAFQKQRRELSVILDSPQYLCSLDPRFLIADMWTAAVPTSQDWCEDKMKNAHQGGPQGPAREEAQETADIPVPHGAKGWGKLTLPASRSTRRRPYQWVTVTMETNKFLHITGESPPASSPGLWGRQKAACSRKLTFLFSIV
ncbi:unnamed protein product, partial [Gulo gulo]